MPSEEALAPLSRQLGVTSRAVREDEEEDYGYHNSGDESDDFVADDSDEEDNMTPEERIKYRKRPRTFDLNIDNNYAYGWKARDGVRELLQNWLDGGVQTHSISAHDIYIRRADIGSAETKKFIQVWIMSDGRKLSKKNGGTWEDIEKDVKVKGKPQKTAEELYGKELGRIEFERKGFTKDTSKFANCNKLKITNLGVELSTDIMVMGSSSKKDDKETAGGHGEGLKVGILQLLKAGYSVKYLTGSQIWTFLLKKPKGASDKVLHLKVARSKKKKISNDTTVIVGGSLVKHLKAHSKPVGVDVFDARLFMFLNQNVSTVRTEEGELIMSLPKGETTHGSVSLGENPQRSPLYIRGLFVQDMYRLKTAVNLFHFAVDRDRRAVADQKKLRQVLNQIWSAALLQEGKESMKLRERFLALAEEPLVGFGTMEQDLLLDMDSNVADVLLSYLKEVECDRIFPIEMRNDGDKEIVGKLKMKPYACNERLLTFLQKSDQVLTVGEAQRKAFMDGIASPGNLGKHKLALCLAKYCSLAKVSEKHLLPAKKVAVSTHFRVETDVGIDGLLVDVNLYVSDRMILEPECHFTCPDVASGPGKRSCTCGLITLISMAERELERSKLFCSTGSDKERLKFFTKKFLAEHADNGYSIELMKPQLHLSLASQSGVEIILAQAKARGLVNPERYLISLRRHTLGARGSHRKPATNLALTVEDCLENIVAVEAGENPVAVDQVANVKRLQSVVCVSQAGVAIEEHCPGNSAIKVDLHQSRNDEETYSEDCYVEEDSVVVLFSNTECGFLRHKVDKLDSAAVYSFAVTAVFDEKKLGPGSDHEVTAISARFCSAPVMRLAEWSEMSEDCLAVDFCSAPLGSRLSVRVEDVATSIGGDLKLAPGVACASLNPRELVGVEFVDTMKLQVRAKLLLSDMEPCVKGSDWSEWTQLETLDVFKTKVERKKTEAVLAKELARKRTHEKATSDSGDGVGGGDGFDGCDAGNDGVSGDEMAFATAAEENGKRPCKKARSLNPNTALPDSANVAAEADVRKLTPDPSSPPNFAAAVFSSKAISVSSTAPDAPVNAVMVEIKKELVFAPQFRRPVGESQGGPPGHVRKSSGETSLHVRKSLGGPPRHVRKSLGGPPWHVRKSLGGAPSSSEAFPVQNTASVKSVKATARRASPPTAGNGNAEAEVGVVKEVEIVDASDADVDGRASVEHVAKVVRPEGWPASIKYTDSLEIDTATLPLVPQDVQKLWYRKNVEIRIIQDAKHPAYEEVEGTPVGKGVFATSNIPKESVIFNYSGKLTFSPKDMPAPSGPYIFRLGLGVFRGYRIDVDAGQMGNESRFVNDPRSVPGAAGPNLRFVKPPNRDVGLFGVINLQAVRDIKEGEELFVCYGRKYFGKHLPCPLSCHPKKEGRRRLSAPSGTDDDASSDSSDGSEDEDGDYVPIA